MRPYQHQFVVIHSAATTKLHCFTYNIFTTDHFLQTVRVSLVLTMLMLLSLLSLNEMLCKACNLRSGFQCHHSVVYHECVDKYDLYLWKVSRWAMALSFLVWSQFRCSNASLVSVDKISHRLVISEFKVIPIIQISRHRLTLINMLGRYGWCIQGFAGVTTLSPGHKHTSHPSIQLGHWL